MSAKEGPIHGVTVNPGYSAHQLAKALTTSEAHADAATRARALEKATKWRAVMDGMLSGQLSIGSRQPVGSLPPWVTLEVLTGGFATGSPMAGGPLLEYEQKLLKRLGGSARNAGRAEINAYYLTESGFVELEAFLKSGCYEVLVPEEGALLAVCWLAGTGHPEAARELIDLIAPHFATLRFYPLPSVQPVKLDALVSVESVSETQSKLARISPNVQILAQRESFEVWLPLYDRMVSLFLETVGGTAPFIQPDAEGRWTSSDGRFYVEGGWPCQEYPSNWKTRGSELLAEISKALAKHKRTKRAVRSKGSFARLHRLLKRCVTNPSALNGRDVGVIRLIMARHLTKTGDPQSERARQLREQQAAIAAQPTVPEIARVLEARLQGFPRHTGLDSVEAIIQPVHREEEQNFHVPAGTVIPESLCRKVERCEYDTIQALVQQGVICSAETMSRLVPQLTARLKALAFEDEKLRLLYKAVYTAFRKRRSLLLLNLEKQVQINELPWVAALEPFRRDQPSPRHAVLTTLKELAALSLKAFPETILPNRMVREFEALAVDAGLKEPWLEELAADIFMEDFSLKYTQAARKAALVYGESLYARYYQIDEKYVRTIPEKTTEPPPPPVVKKTWFGTKVTTSPATNLNPLVNLCIQRAGLEAGQGRGVVRNGMILEQSQILTTHNLAVLFGGLNLSVELCDSLEDMARRCFQWICQQHQMKFGHHHEKLLMLKNTAYAWRQMVFYLSVLAEEQVQGFFTWAKEHLAGQGESFRQKFEPVLAGLIVAHNRTAPAPQRYFTGWSNGPHWLLP